MISTILSDNLGSEVSSAVVQSAVAFSFRSPEDVTEGGEMCSAGIEKNGVSDMSEKKIRNLYKNRKKNSTDL